jgi:hypothetical protein
MLSSAEHCWGYSFTDSVCVRVFPQRTFMIWGFAFRFFFKLWLVGRKFTYGKKVSAALYSACMRVHGQLSAQIIAALDAPKHYGSCTDRYQRTCLEFAPKGFCFSGSMHRGVWSSSFFLPCNSEYWKAAAFLKAAPLQNGKAKGLIRHYPQEWLSRNSSK